MLQPKSRLVITPTHTHTHTYKIPCSHSNTHKHTFTLFLPSSPPECVSVPLSPIEIIYHYIQHTDAPQLLCPGNACSHSAIKAKRHPLPPAPMRVWERRWKASGGEERDGYGRDRDRGMEMERGRQESETCGIESVWMKDWRNKQKRDTGSK